MKVVIFFTLLGSLVSAAPHKRACNRPAGGSSSKVAPQATDIASTTSLKAGAAFGQWKTRTRHQSSATASLVQTSATSEAQPTGADQGGDISSVGLPETSSQAVAPSSVRASSAIVSSAAQPSRSATAAPVVNTTNPVTRSDGSGLAINSESVNSFSGFLQGNLAWYTGWSDTPLKGTDGLEWVPQVWGEQNVANVANAAKNWKDVTHVLSFNEPDMTRAVGGSDMTPQLAATKHKEWVKALGGSYEIGAPAVARGSKKWMQDWVAACNGGCEYSYVPFHYYGTDANDLIKYAQDFYAEFGKPLWLTEWSCKDYSNGYTCNEAEIKTFMKTAIDWFRGEGSDIVQRWAYFGAFPKMASVEGNPNGLENTDGSINEMGKYYISL